VELDLCREVPSKEVEAYDLPESTPKRNDARKRARRLRQGDSHLRGPHHQLTFSREKAMLQIPLGLVLGGASLFLVHAFATGVKPHRGSAMFDLLLSDNGAPGMLLSGFGALMLFSPAAQVITGSIRFHPSLRRSPLSMAEVDAVEVRRVVSARLFGLVGAVDGLFVCTAGMARKTGLYSNMILGGSEALDEFAASINQQTLKAGERQA